jgi:hypothetical protein
MMALPRRVGGAIVLLLSIVGTVCCVAGIIGIWMLHQGVFDRVQRITDRLDTGLLRMSVAVQNIHSAFATARSDMVNIGTESAGLGGGGEKSRRASRAIRTLLQQRARPDLDDLSGRLATLSDAAAAVASLLQSFQELSPGRLSRIEPDRLLRPTDEVRQLSAILRRLEAAFGDEEKVGSQRDVEGATSEVDVILRRCQAAVENWQSDLAAARADLARVRGEIPGWMTYTAAAATALCLWMGVGQISLFGSALRWARGA